MSEKPPAEDQNEHFGQIMQQKGVKKLTTDHHKPTKSKPKPHKRIDYQAVDLTVVEPFFQAADFGPQAHWIQGEDRVEFVRNGIAPRVIQKLKRGQAALDARLDLHHHTAAEAVARTDRFMEDCQHRGKRLILLIHGKGKMSTDKPILKNVIIDHLRGKRMVLALISAHAKHGGAGALYVLLKRGL